MALTRSQYAVPLLDFMFQQPIFLSTWLSQEAGMPSRPAVLSMLAALKEAGILRVVREGRGPRAQVLALAELVNLCEGKPVV